MKKNKDKAISADLINTLGQLTRKAIAIKEISVKNNTLSCMFPPHSFTQIKLGVK